MPGPPQLEDCDRVLVVEGHSDLVFFAAVLRALGKEGQVFIKEFGGRENLTTKLETFLTPQLLASKQAVGIIVDADANPNGIATSLITLLKQLTGSSVKVGEWTNNKPRFGLFVTPDGISNGEIETLVWRAWSADPANAQSKNCISAFVDCMDSAGFKAQSVDKGFVGALLAIRNDDDPRLGPGARANIFDFGRPEFSPLREFLSGL